MKELFGGVLLIILLGVITVSLIVSIFNKNDNDETILSVYTEKGKRNKKASKLPFLLILFVLGAILVAIYVLY